MEEIKQEKITMEFTEEELTHLNNVLGFMLSHIKDTVGGEVLINNIKDRIENIIFPEIPF